MTTITINPRTKAGKTLLELANLLATNNKGVAINTGLNKPQEEKLTLKQRKLIATLKRVKKNADSGNTKYFRPINEVLDEI